MNVEGYPTDLDYTFGYFRVLSPSFLRLVTLNHSVAFPSRRPLRYLELAYGNGVSLNIHAAASPGEYWGTDVNPSHAAFADQLAEKSGSGVHALSLSFADLLRVDELPDFDVIVAHGVWSWISDANRDAILELVRRKLVEGGIFFISYNALPGAAAFIPLQRLLRLPSERVAHGATAVDRLEAGLLLARTLRDSGSKFFASNPRAAERLESLKNNNPAYLYHEYLGENWVAASFAETARKASEAGLDFVGSADLMEHYEDVSIDARGLALLSSIEDGWIRETVRDFLLNRQFRSDVFAKRALKLSEAERQEALQTLAFIRVLPEQETPAVVETPAGQIELYRPPFGDVLAALSEEGYRPKTIGELAERCGGKDEAVRAALLLAQSGIVQPVQHRSLMEVAEKKCRELNATILNEARIGQKIRALASPVTGLGISLTRHQQLFLLAFQAGAKSPQQFANFAWEVLEKQTTLDDSGKTPGPLLGATLLRDAVVFQEYLPILAALGL